MRTNIFHNEHIAISYDVVNGWTVVEIVGGLDIYTAPIMREKVIMLLHKEHRHFVLDLRPAPLVDSMGLGTIVAITKRIRDHEGSLSLVCTDERVLKVFTVGGLRKAYAFHDSIDAATRQAPLHGGLAYWPRPIGKQSPA